MSASRPLAGRRRCTAALSIGRQAFGLTSSQRSFFAV